MSEPVGGARSGRRAAEVERAAEDAETGRTRPAEPPPEPEQGAEPFGSARARSTGFNSALLEDALAPGKEQPTDAVRGAAATVKEATQALLGRGEAAAGVAEGGPAVIDGALGVRSFTGTAAPYGSVALPMSVDEVKKRKEALAGDAFAGQPAKGAIANAAKRGTEELARTVTTLLDDGSVKKSFLGIAATDSQTLQRILKTASPEVKTRLAHEMLRYGNLTAEQKGKLLDKITAGGKPSLDEVVKKLKPTDGAVLEETLAGDPKLGKLLGERASPETQRSIVESLFSEKRRPSPERNAALGNVLAGMAPKDLSGLVSRADERQRGLITLGIASSKELQAKVMRDLSQDEQQEFVRRLGADRTLKPEERTAGLQGMLRNATPEAFNRLVAKGSDNDRELIAAVVTSDPKLQVKVAHELDLKNQQAVIGSLVRLPIAQGRTGSTIATILGNMKVDASKPNPNDAKNTLVRNLKRDEVVWNAVLGSLAYVPIGKSVLPGLDAKNLAAMGRRLQTLSRDAQAGKFDVDPSALGVSVSEEHRRGTSTTKGTSTTVGLEVGGEIPGTGLGITGSLSHEWNESVTESSETANVVTFDKHARETFLAEKKAAKVENRLRNRAVEITDYVQDPFDYQGRSSKYRDKTAEEFKDLTDDDFSTQL